MGVLALVQAATGPLPGQASVQRIYTLPNPAVGVDWTFTVPAGESWVLQAAHYDLVASSAPATRQPLIRYSVSGTIAYQAASPLTVTASQDIGFQFAVGLSPASVTPFSFGQLPNMVLQPGVVVASITTNIQSGDQYSGISFYVLAYT